MCEIPIFFRAKNLRNRSMQLFAVSGLFLLTQMVYAAAPVIVSAGIPAPNTTYVAGQTLDFTITWDQSVIVNTAGGTPYVTVTLDTGGAVHANYLLGSGTPTLTFRYTIIDGNNDNNGIVVADSIVLAGATIQNSGAEAANIMGIPFGATTSVLVDTEGPIVTSVGVPADGTYIAGQNLDFTVNFSEPVVVDITGGTPYLSLILDSGFQFANYLSGGGTTALTFRYMVGTNNYDSDGVVLGGAIILNMAMLRDAAGNNASTTLNSVANTSNVRIDSTPPIVTSIDRTSANPTNAASVEYTVTFSESVSGVDSTDFSVATSGSATGTIATTVLSSPSTYIVTINGISGDGTLRLDLNPFSTDITDLTGNAMVNGGYTAGEIYTIDNTAPSINSINRADATPTTTASVDYTVTFSENVSGVDTADFNLTHTGTANGSIATVAPVSASTYMVTVNDIVGNGTLRLNLNNSGTGIEDTAANLITGGLSGQTYAVSEAIDVQVGISDGQASAVGGATNVYTITVVNNGPETANAVGIHFTPPAEFTAVTWSCLASVGAVCPHASGISFITETATTMPAGGRLTYLVTGTVANEPTPSISCNATITSSNLQHDLSHTDDSATDTDEIGIFGNGFE